MIDLADLPLEIILNVTIFLSDKDILSLCISTKQLFYVLHAVKIRRKVEFSAIKSLPYFDSFLNVRYERFQILFPKNIQILHWDGCAKLPKMLPDTIINFHYECSSDNSYPLETLPLSLQCLNLVGSHREPLPLLPDTLKILDLGYKYDHDLQLPHSLTILILSYFYNRKLPKLPNSLLKLKLSFDYDQPLPPLPNSLKYLFLGSRFSHSLTELPASLTYLSLSHYFNQQLPRLPDALLELKVHCKCNIQLPELPNSLTCLEISDEYTRQLPELPNSLKVLVLGRNYNSPFQKLPASLTDLHLGYNYNQLLPQLPDSLQKLTVRKSLPLSQNISPKITIQYIIY